MHGHLGTIVLLLVLYQLKHFLADYPLQVPWMLGKFKPGWEFLGPLAAHAAVHGWFTFTITMFFNPKYWWLCFVDFSLHFLMDRIKASPKYMGRWKALSSYEYVSAHKKEEDLFLLTQQNQRHRVWNDMAFETAKNYKKVYLENAKKFRDNKLFWWALGFDQMFHHLTHYFIIWMLVKGNF